MRLPWTVWDAADESAPLCETYDVSEAAHLARDRALGGRDVYLEEPEDGFQMCWRDGRFVPRGGWDEVPPILRDWKGPGSRLRVVRVAGLVA